MEILKTKLVKICNDFRFEDSVRIDNLVLETPYIPFIPDSWNKNKVLVLFEAQNLSQTNQDYVDKLKQLPKRDKIERLYEKPNLGIAPWDLGYLDFPLKVCFPDYEYTDFAVGNAVLWSLASEKNLTPTNYIMKRSSELWSLMLNEMEPKIIISVGNKAAYVIEKSSYSGIKISTYFPYGIYPNFVNKHFDFTSLVERNVSVDRALKLLNKSLDTQLRNNKNTNLKVSLPMAISLLQKIESKNTKS